MRVELTIEEVEILKTALAALAENGVSEEMRLNKVGYVVEVDELVVKLENCEGRAKGCDDTGFRHVTQDDPPVAGDMIRMPMGSSNGNPVMVLEVRPYIGMYKKYFKWVVRFVSSTPRGWTETVL